MIVLGADMHKRSHTIAAVAAGTGELLGEQTVPAGAKGAALGCSRTSGGIRSVQASHSGKLPIGEVVVTVLKNSYGRGSCLPHCLWSLAYGGKPGPIVAALAALAIAASGCGGGDKVSGKYVYVSPDGASVESLNLVQHGSRLTGTASVLHAISSDEAEDTFGVLDAQERPVLGDPLNRPVMNDKGEYTAPSDNAACGGTPMCFEALTGALDGQVGAKHRISVRIEWTDSAPFGLTASVGTVRGNGFTLDGDEFKPTDDAHITAARAQAIANLRSVAIPAHQVKLEITALRGPFSDDKATWDYVLAEDVRVLREAVNVADNLNDTLACGYAEIVNRDIEGMQSDINDVAAEINRAEKLLGSLSPAATRAAGGDVATLQATIKARKATIDQETKQANVSVVKANRDVSKVENFLQQTYCGVIHIAAHALLEAGE